MYYYFALWRRDGTDQQIHDLLRIQVREAAGRNDDPSAVVLDSQSVRRGQGAREQDRCGRGREDPSDSCAVQPST